MAKPSPTELNAFNRKMRNTPWYQAWFRSKGLNPNQVQLSDDLRKELTQVLAQNGLPIPNGGLVDKAGNISAHHGFAGQPGWLKALEIGGAVTAGALLGGPAMISAFGHGAPAVVAPAATTSTTAGALAGSSLPAITSMTGAPIVAAHAAPVVASALAPVAKTVVPAVATKVGFGLSDLFKTATAPAINAATNIYATKAQVGANDRAAVLQAEAAKQQLEYLNRIEAERKAEFEKTQALNLDQYNQREARLGTYRRVGEEAITRVGDLVRPGTGTAYVPAPTQYLPARSLVRV